MCVRSVPVPEEGLRIKSLAWMNFVVYDLGKNRTLLFVTIFFFWALDAVNFEHLYVGEENKTRSRVNHLSDAGLLNLKLTLLHSNGFPFPMIKIIVQKKKLQ